MKIPISRFLPINESQIEMVRIWRNKSRIRQNMVDQNIIEPAQQLSWFKTLKDDRRCEYRVFFQDGQPVGMLYFSEIEKESCSWGCYIGEDRVWPGSGIILELAALDYVFKILKKKRLEADVFEENTSAINLHLKFGYSRSSVPKFIFINGKNKKKLLNFYYLDNKWLLSRESIINTLPKQFQAASKLIYYN